MYTIRRITETDIPILAAFEAEISRISFGDEAIDDPAFHAQKIKKGMDKDPRGMFVMADAEERTIGWLWMDVKENFLTGESYVNFRSFYITEENHGTGAADALLRRGMDYCREINAKSVVGKVHVSNVPMRALYKNFGFAATHVTMEYHFPQAEAKETDG